MAKRRKLEAPSTEDLSRIEDEFRRETTQRGGLGAGMAPIAQIAAESAAETVTTSPEARAETARLKAAAEQFEMARGQGLLMADLPVDEIDAEMMIRDRIDLSEAELLELRLSISINGLRLPIEVCELDRPREDGVRYGLVSGYRRLIAVRALLALTEQEKYRVIKAIVRPARASDEAFVAMVEENEVRSALTQFERGRIAVISAQQGAFVNVEEAVNRLYATASKAKRSKVRSFALIFEELGDMLVFPEALTEKRGLQLAQALRQGSERQLRDALAHADPGDAEAEWTVLEAALAETGFDSRDKRRGGRPKTGKPLSKWQDAETITTSSGITIRRGQDQHGLLLRFEGQQLESDVIDRLMLEIQSLLEKS